MSSNFARNVENGIRGGAVNPYLDGRSYNPIRLRSTGPRPEARPCDHTIGTGDEDYASGYVRVETATGKVLTRTGGDLVGVIDGKAATVAATGETVTGRTRKALLTALLLAHNACIAAARRQA